MKILCFSGKAEGFAELGHWDEEDNGKTED